MAHLYLEIAEGTALSTEYWAGWSSAIARAMLFADKPVGGMLVPMLQGLLPCLAIPVLGTAPGRWVVPPMVQAALSRRARVRRANTAFLRTYAEINHVKTYT